MTLSQDILAELAEIAPGSPLDQARAVRDAATRHAQGSYEVLFSQQDADFPLDERFAVAAKVAKLHQADALAAHYAGFGLADPTTDRLVPALAFARLLTFTPVEATPGAAHLNRRGLEPAGIVTLAQLVAFVSFQSRLLLGLRALNHKPIVSADTPVVAGYWHTTRKPRAAKRPRCASPAMNCTGNPGWRINRWRNLALKNRRFWQIWP
jgi:uncharacterized protein YciW